MRRIALLLLIVPLAACSSGGNADDAASVSTSKSAASSSALSSSAASTSAALEAGVQRDCLTASLGYVPLKTALAGSDADLMGALQFIEAADLDAAGETQRGKDAELALAELGVQVATAHALASSNVTPDRAALQQAYADAAAACQPFGASF